MFVAISGPNCVYHCVLIVTVFLVLNLCTFIRAQIAFYFINFFHHWPFSILPLAASTNLTLLIPIPTSVFSFNNSPWLARGADFTIVVVGIPHSCSPRCCGLFSLYEGLFNFDSHLTRNKTNTYRFFLNLYLVNKTRNLRTHSLRLKPIQFSIYTAITRIIILNRI